MDTTNPSPGAGTLAWVGLVLVAALSLSPLLLEAVPVQFAAPFGDTWAQWGAKGLVILLMLSAVAVRSWADRRDQAHAALLNAGLFVLAGLLTAWHWHAVDSRWQLVYEKRDHQLVPARNYFQETWQRTTYQMILNHGTKWPKGNSSAPHCYRPLPYGFTRTLELLTGDWWFACLAYRSFFTFWLLWGYVRFLRLFHDTPRALLALGVLVVLYPLSIKYYRGQLTDPMSHALFVLSLIYMVRDRWLLLAATLMLGVLCKETAVLVVPAYWACHWRQGWAALFKTTALGLACTAAFLAVRLPLGWSPAYAALNGTKGLMIGTNLGIGTPLYNGVAATYLNYLHPILFVGFFLPLILAYWRRVDSHLKALFVTLTPLLLASNLCFGWLFESRNYVPLLPVLTAMALSAGMGRFAAALGILAVAVGVTLALPDQPPLRRKTGYNSPAVGNLGRRTKDTGNVLIGLAFPGSGGRAAGRGRQP